MERWGRVSKEHLVEKGRQTAAERDRKLKKDDRQKCGKGMDGEKEETGREND